MKILAAVLDSSGEQRPYASFRPLSITEVELDPPAAGELLVRIEAAGLCHSDLSVIDGSRPRPLPMVLGHEAAGVVEALGPGVGGVAVGDHVVLTFVPSCGSCRDCTGGRQALCSAAASSNRAGSMLVGGRRLSRNGSTLNHHLGVSAFATHAVVSRSAAVVIPRDVPLDVAALFGCAVLTGVGAVVETAHVRPGQSVAVFGLGGVGLSAIMGAAFSGAAPIVGIDPVAAKRELALMLGATAVFDPAEAEQALGALTQGGADVAIETAGNADALAAAYSATRRGGSTVVLGLPDPSQEIRLPIAAFVGEGRALLGSYMGDSAPQRDIPRLLRLWRGGRLPVEQLLSGTSPIARINEGMDALADGLAVRQIIKPHS